MHLLLGELYVNEYYNSSFRCSRTHTSLCNLKRMLAVCRLLYDQHKPKWKTLNMCWRRSIFKHALFVSQNHCHKSYLRWKMYIFTSDGVKLLHYVDYGGEPGLLRLGVRAGGGENPCLITDMHEASREALRHSQGPIQSVPGHVCRLTTLSAWISPPLHCHAFMCWRQL